MIHNNRLALVDLRNGPVYDYGTREVTALGEIETVTLDMAAGLSQLMKVVVWQTGRESMIRSFGVTFKRYPLSGPANLGADYLVVLANPKVLPRLRETNPRARLFLWLHGLLGRHHKQLADICLETGATLVTGSRFHADEVKAYLRGHGGSGAEEVPVVTIPNPVAVPSFGELPFDEDKLIVMNHEQSGMSSLLDVFSYCRKAYPSLRLHVFDDATTSDANTEIGHDVQGVVHMGAQPAAKVFSHLASAFCLFSPVLPHRETFGLPFAQANAVGLPVIAPNTGSAFEVIQGCRSQLLDDLSPANVLATIGKWRRMGRPLVRMRKAFRMEAVAAEWIKTLLAAPPKEQTKENITGAA